MRKILTCLLALSLFGSIRTLACTNVIVTAGASADGSCMISYAADSHWLYGELYYTPAGRFNPGSRLSITEWDTSRPLGSIPQVPSTYRTVGNMNEHQLIIGETTWGGREEQMDTTGIMDYGSLIYIALQRARTAREAIDVIVSLANTYGYASEGETFSIADPREAWVMDLVGKGSGNKGIVWVARRIPDGYICAHANQCRITTFPQDDPENTIFAPDVISYARSMGWYEGPDETFSFRDAYNPLDFGAARGCDSRAWSAFNILCDGTFTFQSDGILTSRSASDYLPYAMGYDLKGEMPLWVKPSRKISFKDVADVMRDHFEGTPMDMRVDVGAGGNACPYRWRPMEFEWEGQTYVNERAIATQQTGFWFVAQARGYLPDEIGALLWFGVDDAATSYLCPIYVNISEVPLCYRKGNGNLLQYSPTSAFWMCNRVTNSCYRMYDRMEPYVRAKADAMEMEFASMVRDTDSKALRLYEKGRHRRLHKILTAFTLSTAEGAFNRWKELEEHIMVKFIDGNVKAEDDKGNFLHTIHDKGIPDGLTQPGYTSRWKAAVVHDNGEILKVR